MMETAEMMYCTVPYDGNSDDYEGWKAAQDARAAGRGRGAGGGGNRGGRNAQDDRPRANNGLTGNPHPATAEIGADLAEIGISNTVNQVQALLAGRYGR
jgi:hypothetical protein